MNLLEYSKIITGKNERYEFELENIYFCLNTFGNHDKAYIFLITEKNINHSGQRQKCIYTIQENNMRVVTDIESYFVFIANQLKDKMEDFLFSKYKLKQKLEKDLINNKVEKRSKI